MFRRKNIPTPAYLALRQVGELPQDWVSEKRFAALYPKKYFQQKEYMLGEKINWQSFCQEIIKDALSMSGAWYPWDKELFECILKGDVQTCRDILYPRLDDVRHYGYPVNSLTEPYLQRWVDVNPFSAMQPNFTMEIRDIIWEYIQSSNHGANMLLQFAVITHQPVNTFVTLIARFQNNQLDISQPLYDCLKTAVKLSQKDTATYLLQEMDVDPNRESCDSSLLSYAAANSDTEMVALLLQYGANARDSYYHLAPIHKAAGSGNAEIVRLLLQNGASVHGEWRDHHTRFSLTPVSIACQQGHLGTVKILIDNGAILHDVRSRVDTLSSACLNRHYHVAEHLLNVGVKINGQVMLMDRNTVAYTSLITEGTTILHVACIIGGYENRNIELAKFLIKHGADINQPDLHHSTPVHLACQKFFDTAFLHYLLLETNANWFCRDEKGFSPLHYLEANGMDKKSLLIILETIVNHLNLAALNLDAEWNAESGIPSYLYTDLLVRLCTDNPDLLLQYALISRQNLAEIDRIINMGASVNGLSKYKHTPSQLAQTLYPAALVKLEVKEAQADLRGFGFFDLNSEEQDLLQPEETNPKKRNRE